MTTFVAASARGFFKQFLYPYSFILLIAISSSSNVLKPVLRRQYAEIKSAGDSNTHKPMSATSFLSVACYNSRLFSTNAEKNSPRKTAQATLKELQMSDLISKLCFSNPNSRPNLMSDKLMITRIRINFESRKPLIPTPGFSTIANQSPNRVSREFDCPELRFEIFQNPQFSDVKINFPPKWSISTGAQI